MKETCIASYNVNGIRAAMRKGFLEWLENSGIDIICLQETKIQEGQIDVAEFEKIGYKHCWYYAEKKGYSGVAILSKIEPTNVEYGCGIANHDAEGRMIKATFGDVTVINNYFPSGTSGDVRQDFKYKFLDEIYDYFEEYRKSNPNLIIVGDYNIAHTSIDIHNPVSNKKSSGFLPEERAWLTKFFNTGYIDTFREFCDEPHHYSWWSYRANSRANNKGWRIDYCAATETLKDRLTGAGILPDAHHSDHCPIYVKVNM